MAAHPEPDRSTLLQINATIMVGLLVLAAAASVFPFEPLSLNNLGEKDSEERQQVIDRAASITKSGVILFVTGVMIAPFAGSILFLLNNRLVAARRATGIGVSAIVALILALGVSFMFLGVTLTDLVRTAP